jgi:hypothetical protein
MRIIINTRCRDIEEQEVFGEYVECETLYYPCQVVNEFTQELESALCDIEEKLEGIQGIDIIDEVKENLKYIIEKF